MTLERHPQPFQSADQLMTADQVAEMLLVRRSTVEAYARRGLLPSIKLGRHRRFVRADILDAIDRRRDAAVEEPRGRPPRPPM